MKWKQDYAIFLVFMILAHECSCDDCRYGAGIGYQGTRHVTKRNIFCQNWNIDYPHVPQYSPNANPDAGLHNNYCRNPNNDEAGPWCYTSSPVVRWEYCDVPMCGCEDWETKNGSMCVCKEMTDCGAAGPSVCDNEGNQYVNYCAFSVSLCQNIIPLNRTQESCGKCSHLKLTRGEGAKGEHRTYGLVSFEPTEDTHDGRTVYKSLARYNRNVTLQFDEKMQRWIIGERASDGQIYLAAYTLSDALWPQDSKAGWVIYDTDGDGNGTWKEDALIQLHCFDGNIKGPQPRLFGFLIAMIVISLVTTTTSLVLQAVQLQKGCLWYPSVCTLTQEVKSLKGQVESKNIAILNGFGNPFEVKVEYLQINSNNGDISNRLCRIMEMITDFSADRGFLKDLQGSLLDDDVRVADEIIKSFNLQGNAELKDLGIRLGMQSGFDLIEVFSLSFTAVSTSTAALSAVGAVLSVAMFIFNVVHSVQKERQVRDDLIDAKSKLLNQMTRLREAEKQIQLFCSLVCKTDVVFLKNILQKFADFLQNNQKYSDILKWNKDVSTRFIKYGACNPSQVTLNNLKHLKHIQKQLIDLLDKEIEGFKKAIEKAQNWNRLKENILEKAQKQYSVEKIMLTIPDLKTRKETLVLIAAFLPNIDCYWGYDLEKIRKKEFTSPLLEIPVTESLIQKILIMIRFDFPLINLKRMLCSNINCASSGVDMQLVALAKPDMQFYQSQYLPNFPCRNSLPSSVTML